MPERFEDKLRRALAEPEPASIDIEGARRAAILIPLVAAPDPEVILTIRTDTVRSHKGQISFPGGSIDPNDDSPEAAALRETEEELGLDPSSVRVLGRLESVPTFVSGYVVAPFVGWLDEAPTVKPNPAEVAAVLQIPVGQLNDEIRVEPGFVHAERTYPTEAWIWEGHVIWGVTARILRIFLSRLAAAGLVSAPGGAASWPPIPAAAR